VPELSQSSAVSVPPNGKELSAELRNQLLDPAAWKAGLETYAAAMRLAVALTGSAGNIIGPCINPQPTWSLFHRKESVSAGTCPFSLAALPPCTCVADALKQGTVIVARDRTGLVHFAVPLRLGEHRLGALIAGQVFDRYPEQLPLEQAAKRCGLSPDKVAQMARREHPLSRETLRVYGDLLAAFGNAFLQTRYHTLQEAQRLAEMTKLHEQLFQARKMETIGRLAGGVAHDFNNLMTPILGHCDILLGKLAPDDPMCESVRVIRTCGERAAIVTRQLLAFGRKQILTPRVLSLNAVVIEMDPMFAGLLGENMEQARDLDPSLGRVKADRGQIEQVLLNLVVNARDAMSRGGRLTIASRNVELSEADTKENSEIRPGPYAMLSVSDTGCGMDEQTQAHLFEPFFTTKEVGKGTGLGLASIYGIVSQSGGHVKVRSESGSGSTFSIYLPRVEAMAPPSEERASLPVARGGPEMVLLVEDEKLDFIRNRE
jgi:signal transduction histidine kinase